MAFESYARPRKRRGPALVLVTLLATAGIAGAWYLVPRDVDAPEAADASVPDASVDARAPTTKAKPGKKPAARGGKTRVAGRATGGGAPHAATAGRHGGPAAGSRHDGPAAGAPQDGPAEGDSHDAPPAAGRHGGRHDGPVGPSYDSALGSNDDHVTIGVKGKPDLTDAQLSAPMSDGSFIGDCDAPDNMSVTVKVAIRMGRAVGVSVETDPASPHVAGCIDHHVRGLSWPAHTRMDSLVTSY